jgi:hypothetical protein
MTLIFILYETEFKTTNWPNSLGYEPVDMERTTQFIMISTVWQN